MKNIRKHLALFIALVMLATTLGPAAVAQSHSVTLTFTPSVTPGTTTDIYRGPCGAEQLLQAALSVAIYVDTTVVDGQTYCYFTRALLGSIESVNSNSVSVVIPGGTVTPPPPPQNTFNFAPAPASLTFSGQSGSTIAAQQLAIRDNDPNTSHAYTVAADKPWITLSATSGTTSGTVAVGINATGLAAGSYTGNVVLASSTLANSPYSVPVSLTVSAGATYTMSAAPAILNLNAAAGATATATIKPTDSTPSGTGTVPIALSTDQAWLRVSPATGRTGGTFTVTATQTAAGTFSGNVIITETGPNTGGLTLANSPLKLPVTFVVTAVTPPPAPTLSCGAPTVTATATPGTYTVTMTCQAK